MKIGIMSLFYPATTPTMLRRKRLVPWPTVMAVIVAGVSVWMIIRLHHLQTVRKEQTLAEAFAPHKVKPQLAAQLEARAAPPPVEPLPEPVRVPYREYLETEKTAPDDASRAFDQASMVLKRAMQLGAEDSIQSLVRHPELTLPRYQAWSEVWRMAPAMPLQIGPKFGTTERLLVTSVRMEDGSSRHVVLERSANGYKLDWESLAGWGECSFADVVNLPLNKPTLLRIVVQPTSAKPPFPHLAGMSLQVSHPEQKLTLTAFASHATLEKSKAGIMMRDQVHGPFTVRIVVDADCVKHGWVRIQEVICSGWVAD